MRKVAITTPGSGYVREVVLIIFGVLEQIEPGTGETGLNKALSNPGKKCRFSARKSASK
jgi:hypothetical protein